MHLTVSTTSEPNLDDTHESRVKEELTFYYLIKTIFTCNFAVNLFHETTKNAFFIVNRIEDPLQH